MQKEMCSPAHTCQITVRKGGCEGHIFGPPVHAIILQPGLGPPDDRLHVPSLLHKGKCACIWYHF